MLVQSAEINKRTIRTVHISSDSNEEQLLVFINN